MSTPIRPNVADCIISFAETPVSISKEKDKATQGIAKGAFSNLVSSLTGWQKITRRVHHFFYRSESSRVSYDLHLLLKKVASGIETSMTLSSSKEQLTFVALFKNNTKEVAESFKSNIIKSLGIVKSGRKKEKLNELAEAVANTINTSTIDAPLLKSIKEKSTQFSEKLRNLKSESTSFTEALSKIKEAKNEFRIAKEEIKRPYALEISDVDLKPLLEEMQATLDGYTKSILEKIPDSNIANIPTEMAALLKGLTSPQKGKSADPRDYVVTSLEKGVEKIQEAYMYFNIYVSKLLSFEHKSLGGSDEDVARLIHEKLLPQMESALKLCTQEIFHSIIPFIESTIRHGLTEDKGPERCIAFLENYGKSLESVFNTLTPTTLSKDSRAIVDENIAFHLINVNKLLYEASVPYQIKLLKDLPVEMPLQERLSLVERALQEMDSPQTKQQKEVKEKLEIIKEKLVKEALSTFTSDTEIGPTSQVSSRGYVDKEAALLGRVTPIIETSAPVKSLASKVMGAVSVVSAFIAMLVPVVNSGSYSLPVAMLYVATSAGVQYGVSKASDKVLGKWSSYAKPFLALAAGFAFQKVFDAGLKLAEENLVAESSPSKGPVSSSDAAPYFGKVYFSKDKDGNVIYKDEKGNVIPKESFQGSFEELAARAKAKGIAIQSETVGPEASKMERAASRFVLPEDYGKVSRPREKGELFNTFPPGWEKTSGEKVRKGEVWDLVDPGPDGVIKPTATIDPSLPVRLSNGDIRMPDGTIGYVEKCPGAAIRYDKIDFDAERDHRRFGDRADLSLIEGFFAMRGKTRA